MVRVPSMGSGRIHTSVMVGDTSVTSFKHKLPTTFVRGWTAS